MSELHHVLAQRLMNLHNEVASKPSARAIFGSGNELTANLARQMPYRIGLWPCIGDDTTLSIAVWSALAHLLEVRNNIQVYRIFANLGDVTEHSIDVNTLTTQFSVDDWIFEELNENIAVWGHLTSDNQVYELTLWIESDFVKEEDAVAERTFRADNLSQLVNQLPAVADFVIDSSNGDKDIEQKKVFTPTMPEFTASNPNLFDAVHSWEMTVMGFLWNGDIDDEVIIALFEKMMVACETDWDYWLVGATLYHATLPGLSLIGEVLVEEALAYEYPVYADYNLFVARAMLRLGRASEAYQFMQDVEEHYGTEKLSVALWLTYADLLIRMGDLTGAIEIFQSAIELDAVSVDLYRLYAYTLELAERYDINLSTFILIDPEERLYDRLLWEAISAYDEILRLDASNNLAIFQQLPHLITLDIPEFWQIFEKLVQRDEHYEFVSDAVALLENHDVDDINQGIQILEKQISVKTDVYALEMALLKLLIIDSQTEPARTLLQKLRAHKEASNNEADLDYLTLMLEFDNFSYWLGEVQTIVMAGNRLTQQNIRQLERAMAVAPNMMLLHILYAKALLATDEASEALDHLLDVYAEHERDIVLITMIVEILREFDDDALTVEYIKKGLEIDPMYAPLLIQATHFYLDIESYDIVRSFLAQLESHYPNAPELKELRQRIAQALD